MDGVAAAGSQSSWARGDHIHPTDATRAPLASPALTGTPTAPTASPGTNTTQVATTAFVSGAVSAATAGVSSIDFTGVGMTPGPGATGAVTVGGILNVANGGTGKATNVLNGILVGGGTNPIKASAAAPGAGALLIGAAAAVPTWLAVGANGYFLTVASGTPAWVDATATFLPLAGGTMTGQLTVGPASGNATIALNKASGTAIGNQIYGVTAGSVRWQLLLGDNVAEAAGNVGSNFVLNRYDNTGTFLDAPLSIARATGQATFSQSINVTPVSSAPVLWLNKPSSGQASAIVGTKAGSLRWDMDLGNATAEGGSNSGSDFGLGRYSDAGAYVDTPLSIVRATGQATFSQQVNVAPSGGSPTLNLTKSASGAACLIVSHTAANMRWQLQLGNGDPESGSNAGSNFYITSYTDAGAGLANPLWINRATGVTTVTNGIITSGLQINTGGGAISWSAVGTNGINYNRGGILQTNLISFGWSNTSQLHGQVDGTDLGYLTFSSDYRIKTNVENLSPMWDKVKALRPISYEQQDYTPPDAPMKEDGSPPDPLFRADGIERWGFIAHELQDTLIRSAASGVKDQPGAIQAPNPWTVIAALTSALQEAMARIEALEAAR
jgi:hypothetical protein